MNLYTRLDFEKWANNYAYDWAQERITEPANLRGSEITSNMLFENQDAEDIVTAATGKFTDYRELTSQDATELATAIISEYLDEKLGIDHNYDEPNWTTVTEEKLAELKNTFDIGKGYDIEVNTDVDFKNITSEMYDPLEAKPVAAGQLIMYDENVEPDDRKYAGVEVYAHPIDFVYDLNDENEPLKFFNGNQLVNNGIDAVNQEAVPKEFYQAGLDKQIKEVLDLMVPEWAERETDITISDFNYEIGADGIDTQGTLMVANGNGESQRISFATDFYEGTVDMEGADIYHSTLQPFVMSAYDTIDNYIRENAMDDLAVAKNVHVELGENGKTTGTFDYIEGDGSKSELEFEYSNNKINTITKDGDIAMVPLSIADNLDIVKDAVETAVVKAEVLAHNEATKDRHAKAVAGKDKVKKNRNQTRADD